ncbi:MAG: tellurite resistance TerB family protein [Oscillatoriales cyanobacterium RM1_1_9]|nr:tellurite resistance TerB family protein [Oscillatoriales cyanobacterium RM1_1_9]
MNLLEIVFKSQEGERVSFSPAQAFAAIGVASIAADGYLSEQKRQRIVELLLAQSLFADYSEPRLRKMLEDLFNLLSNRGLEPLVAIARESLPSEYQESAFKLAIDLALVDGELSAQEKEFVRHLWKIMDIPVEIAAEILEAIASEHNVNITP